MRIHIGRRLLTLALASLLGSQAYATDGYFATGFGVKQQGRGGAGIGLPKDSLAAATNPAGLVLVGNRFDIGATFFRPIRSGSIVGSQTPVNGDYDANYHKDFFIPELGYSHLLNPRFALGISAFGNGGLNTSYTTAIPLLGSTKAGVDLEQLFISPTAAFKLNDHNTLGASLNIAYQRFEAGGLQNFDSPYVSSAPGSVTNRSYDSSKGVGVRVGWLGEYGHIVTLGATYQSKTYSQKFHKYKGLFAEQGGFDIPANFAGGIGVKVRPNATILVDVQRILYSGVKSISNSGANQALLGSDNGPGFGWHDITVAKVGADVKVARALTLRGGYNYSGLPFSRTQTFFNLLAPGVVQHHLATGLSLGLKGGREINFAYQHAFEQSVNGFHSISPNFGGGEANVRMHQNVFGVSFGWNRE